MRGWTVDEKFAFEPGDMLLFDESCDDNLGELFEHFVANGIEAWTRSNWSHSALVLEPRLIDAKELCLIESTIRGLKNGPQINPLRQRIEETKGPSVWCLKMRADARNAVKWGPLWQEGLGRVGKNKYSVRTILHHLLRPVFPFVKHFSTSHKGEVVCSELVALMFKAGGIEVPEPNTCSPQTLFELPIWGSATQVWSE